MKNFHRLLVAFAALAFAGPAPAALSVFACEPEWAALAQELGGDKVSTFAATTALQDPHRIEARPSLISRIRNADLVICSGSELEIGWLPVLLRQSGNARVQPGSSGYLEASQYVTKLEVPRALDRSMGDIHPGGNPHVHTDPRNILKIAAVLASRLAQLDAANAATYRAKADDFTRRWRAAMEKWQDRAARLKGVRVVEHHKLFTYLFHWLDIREVGTLEPKPGIPPTTSSLAELVERMKTDPAKLIIYSSYNDPRAAEFLAQRTGIPKVMLPFTVGGTQKAKDLFGYFDDLIERLLAPLQ